MARDQRMKKGFRAVVAIGLSLVFLPFSLGSAMAGGPKDKGDKGRDKGRISKDLDATLKSSSPDDLVAVIVQTTGTPSLGHMARLHGRGGSMKMRHKAVRGYSAKIPASQVRAFSEDPEVERLSFDLPVRAALDNALRAVRADVAFAASGGLDGAGVGVAVIDTGTAAHPDLMRPAGAAQPLEVEIVGHETGLADYFGHGTLVAGIINGSGGASSGPDAFRTFRGLAPGARLISIRALASDGSGRTSDIIAGVDWAISHKAEYNIRVLNMSLGHPVFESYTTDPLCLAARAAVEAGIVVVVSAGNDGAIGSGFGTITSPGNEPSVITVGAVDDSNTVAHEDDVLAPYSSKGPSLVDFVVKPDLVAPGSRIVSLRSAGSFLDTNYHVLALKAGDYKGSTADTSDGDYYEISGTSLAAPMVSAAAAMMIQGDPTLTPATVKARLMASAVKDDRMPFETGAGFLDVAAALTATGVAASALSPLAVPMPDGTVSISDTSILWGLAWGQSAIWGGGGRLEIQMTSVENDQVTAESLLWGGGGSLTSQTTGVVGAQSLLWGGGGN